MPWNPDFWESPTMFRAFKRTWSLDNEKEPCGIRAPMSIIPKSLNPGQGAPQGCHWWKRGCERDQQPVLRVTSPHFKGLLPVTATSGSFPFVSLCADPLLHYCQWACKPLLRPDMWITNGSAMEIKLPDLLAFFSLMSAWIGIFDWNTVLILRAGKAATTFSTRENSLLFFPNCFPKERVSQRVALQKAWIVFALLSDTGSRKQLLCSCSNAQPQTAAAWASCIISIQITWSWKWKVSLTHGWGLLFAVAPWV